MVPSAFYEGTGKFAEWWQKVSREVGQRWRLKPCALGVARLQILGRQSYFHIYLVQATPVSISITLTLIWKEGKEGKKKEEEKKQDG